LIFLKPLMSVVSSLSESQQTMIGVDDMLSISDDSEIDGRAPLNADDLATTTQNATNSSLTLPPSPQPVATPTPSPTTTPTATAKTPSAPFSLFDFYANVCRSTSCKVNNFQYEGNLFADRNDPLWQPLPSSNPRHFFSRLSSESFDPGWSRCRHDGRAGPMPTSQERLDTLVSLSQLPVTVKSGHEGGGDAHSILLLGDSVVNYNAIDPLLCSLLGLPKDIYEGLQIDVYNPELYVEFPTFTIAGPARTGQAKNMPTFSETYLFNHPLFSKPVFITSILIYSFYPFNKFIMDRNHDLRSLNIDVIPLIQDCFETVGYNVGYHHSSLSSQHIAEYTAATEKILSIANAKANGRAFYLETIPAHFPTQDGEYERVLVPGKGWACTGPLNVEQFWKTGNWRNAIARKALGNAPNVKLVELVNYFLPTDFAGPMKIAFRDNKAVLDCTHFWYYFGEASHYFSGFA
jgi:hypothetical protein